MTKHLRTWIEINESALSNNIQIFDRICQGKIWMPVVKSNAYGHGLEEILQVIIKKSHLLWIGVNDVGEASFLRKKGFEKNILVCGPLFEEELEEAAHIKAHVFLGSKPVFQKWLQLKDKPFIHLKIDTGLSRQGFIPEELPDILPALAPHKDKLAGLCTHFANVEDVTDVSYANFQLGQLAKAIESLEHFDLEPIFHHAASSASSLIMPSSRLDLCRVGISFYGLWPSELTRLSYATEHKNHLHLQPALSWKCRIANIKDISEGSYVGYGCAFRANRAMKVAVLPVGYFEGYPRLAGSGHSYVLIGKKRCSILGRICMNMMIVDVSQLQDCHVGQIATLIGKDGNETIQAEQLAGWAQSINYEITTRLHPSLTRIIV